MKTIQELIEQRAEKAARMKELTDMFVSEQRHSTAEEGAEFDQLAEDVGSLDDDIRVAKMHQFTASTASAVQGNTQRAATQSRGRGPAIILNREPEDKFPGQSYTRGVIAKALAFLNQTSADRIAEARWGKSHPTLVNVIKADVAGGGSGSGEWGAELVSADNRFTGDFLEYLYSMTVFDRLPLKSIPANVAVKGQDGASTGYWVGESKSIPATTADFSSVSLTPLKVAALAVVSNELLRDSSPSAEMLVRDSLVEAAAQIADTTFLSTSAASAGVSPAGILNGVTIGTSAGATADDMREDIAGLINLFIAAKYRMTGLAFIMTPSLALQISLMRNALGQAEYPSITMNGGTLEGIPVYTGHNVGTGDFILASTADIWKIGDGGLQVSMSRDAMIEQSDAPTGATDTPVAASTKFTSMFQAESTAIKVVRSMNFQKRRSNAVAYIGNAAYGGATSI